MPYSFACSGFMKKSRSKSARMRSSVWPVWRDEDAAQDVVLAQDLARLDLDVRRLAADAAAAEQRLVHVDRRVRHHVALARRARAQQHRPHARRHADGVRRHVRPHELHRVVDRQPGRDRSARRVDVEVDVLLRILALQVQQLRRDHVRHLVVDRRAEKDDALAQQQRVDVERPLAARAGLDDGWDEHGRLQFVVVVDVVRQAANRSRRHGTRHARHRSPPAGEGRPQGR